MKILAIDIGAGTEDVLLFDSDDVPLSVILQKRFALGEITKSQYEEIKRMLSDKEEGGEVSET